MKNTLLNNSEIRRVASNIDISNKVFPIIEEWNELLKEKKLKGEVKNYLKFYDKILKGILGYTEADIKFEESIENIGRVEFVLLNGIGKLYCVIEVKGQNISLDSRQTRKNDKRTPIEQAFSYALGKSEIEWIIITNYNEFRLYNYQHKTNYISLEFNELLNIDMLKIFYLLFSKETLIQNLYVNRILEQTIVIEEELSNDFYKLISLLRKNLITQLTTFMEYSIEESIKITQLLINRYLFCCFAEDSYGNLIPSQTTEKILLSAIQTSSIKKKSCEIWEKINELFIDLRNGNDFRSFPEFNGGLFNDILPNNLFLDILEKVHIDDIFYDVSYRKIKERIPNPLREIINPIYLILLKISNYDYKNEINVDILGHIFEQSIIDIELLLQGETFEALEKKRSSGIFYTPENVTDFIVRNSVFSYLSSINSVDIGSLLNEYKDNLDQLEDKLKNIRILDPSCGSGAFLYKAVQILTELINEIYQYKIKITGELPVFIDKITTMRNIVTNNIFGVDVNNESVGITKLSLFLKIASKNVHLPKLDNNIICGNSLISDLDISDKALDWKKTFPDFLNVECPNFNRYGFDCIIGNPPYIRIHRILKKEAKYFSKVYKLPYGKYDISILFFELADNLISNDGIISYISSVQFSNSSYGKNLRKLLSQRKSHYIVYFGEFKVFKDATTYTAIFSFSKGAPQEFNCYDGGLSLGLDPKNIGDFFTRKFIISNNNLSEKVWNLVPLDWIEILDKMRNNDNSKVLESLADIRTGIVTGNDDIFIKSKEECNENNFKQEILRGIVMGDEVSKWYIETVRNYCIYNSYLNKDKNKTEIIPISKMRDLFPNISAYLESKREILLQRKDGRKQLRDGKLWWGLMRFGSIDLLDKKKLFLKVPSKHVCFGLDESKRCSIVRIPYITPKDEKSLDIYYLLGFLNCKLSDFYFRLNCPIKRGGYFEITVTKIKKIPFIITHEGDILKISDLVKNIIEDVKEINKIISSIKLWYKVKFSDEIILNSISNEDEFIRKNRNKIKDLKNADMQLIMNKITEILQQIRELRYKVEKNRTEIDNMFYEIYNITKEEKEIIDHVCDVWKASL